MIGPMVTGVGSLPHRHPAASADFVLQWADIPYLPQLPHRHPEEGMLVQWGDGLCGCGAVPDGLGLRYGVPSGPRHEAFVGAEALLAALPPEVGLLKTQATGPITMALALLAAGHPADGLWDCVVEGLVRRVERHLAWVEGRTSSRPEIILIFDEPGLAGLRMRGFPLTAADVRAVLRATLGALPLRAGLHCCADTDWALVASLRPAWLSWDVSTLGPGFQAAGEELAQAVMRGSRIIWGVVPPQMGALPEEGELIRRLRRAESQLVLGGADLVRLSRQALFSPGCGLAGLSEGQAEMVCSRVRVVAGELSAHG